MKFPQDDYDWATLIALILGIGGAIFGLFFGGTPV